MHIEEVVKRPLPGMAVPAALAFSPDDRWITYLHSPQGDLTRQLYLLDPQTGQAHLLLAPPEDIAGEETLSLEEKLRRERQRQLELGVTQYAWSKHAGRILAPLQDGLYVVDGPDGPLRKLADSGLPPLLDPRLSPDGEWVAYVQDAELYVIAAGGGEPRRLTQGARGTGRTHGLAEYIAQEEMGRRYGFWWSPDSRQIAFAEVDETHIPVYRIVHQGQNATGQTSQEDHRYPFAGQANARVRLGVVPVEGMANLSSRPADPIEPTWMDLGGDEDVYLARVAWLPDGRLSAQVENRAQTRLDLLAFDPETGQGDRLLREESSVWINLHDLFKPLQRPRADGGGFLWASERTGYRHLYLYSWDGACVRALTAGAWMVDGLAGVDEEAGQVYFTASRESPTESHLYAVSLAGGEPRRITQEPGTHTVVLDHGCRRFVDTYHALETPPTVSLRSLDDGATLRVLHAPADPRVPALPLRPPEIVQLENREGITLYGAIYRPPESFGAGPYPTLVSVYGGPHAQLVTNGWKTTVNLRAQYLSSLGFLVFTLDNRGSARRGLAFEGAIRHAMGRLEVDDQVDGVRWLVAQGLANPKRVGIYGWSYGGYMAAICLARAPETFRVAVAGAPVTHWDGYDTHYTERYMGTPQSNAQGYEESSVMHHVEQIQGRLMLVHGLIDENVHFRHTARLLNALIQARKPYELLLFPDERHTPRRLADRIYMEERIRDFLVQNL